jgi:hypothetical protein
MRNVPLRAVWVAACLCALPTAWAAGKIEVQWLDPGNYSDAGRSAVDREHVMEVLGTHMSQLGRLLPDGQTLRLEITDLDLAGELRWVRSQELRVLRGRADWPHMRLRFMLDAEGRTLKKGEAHLSDMAYLFRTRQGELDYEKHMIEAWVKESFAAP